MLNLTSKPQEYIARCKGTVLRKLSKNKIRKGHQRPDDITNNLIKASH